MMESREPQPGADDQIRSLLATRRLGPLGSGVLSLVLVASLFGVPLLGFLVAPFAIIPLLHYQATSNRPFLAWSWVVVLLAVAAVSGFRDLSVPLLGAYLFVAVLPTLSVFWWQRWGWTEGRWVALTTALASICCLAVLVSMTSPLTPMDGIAQWVRDTGEQAEKLYSAMGESRSEIELALDAAEQYAPWVLPFFILSYFVIVLFWIRPRLAVLGYPVGAGKFEDYCSEEWLPAGFAVFGLGTLFLEGTAKWAASSLLFAVLILYFVHGLAIIRAHLARWVGRGWLVRWFVALICLQMPLPLLVVTLGVADSFHSLRPRRDADDDGGRHESDS